MCRIEYYLYCSTINQSINQSISIYLSIFLSLYLSLSTLFLFTEFVYGIHLIFFESSCIESLSLRSFRPLRPLERPMRARSTLEFQPASCAQSRASVPRRFACVGGDTYGVVES